jgi:hypothetical protein
MGWAGARAWRVETVEAAIGLNHSGLGRKCWLQIAKALTQFRIVG